MRYSKDKSIYPYCILIFAKDKSRGMLFRDKDGSGDGGGIFLAKKNQRPTNCRAFALLMTIAF